MKVFGALDTRLVTTKKAIEDSYSLRWMLSVLWPVFDHRVLWPQHPPERAAQRKEGTMPPRQPEEPVALITTYAALADAWEERDRRYDVTGVIMDQPTIEIVRLNRKSECLFIETTSRAKAWVEALLWHPRWSRS